MFSTQEKKQLVFREMDLKIKQLFFVLIIVIFVSIFLFNISSLNLPSSSSSSLNSLESSKQKELEISAICEKFVRSADRSNYEKELIESEEEEKERELGKLIGEEKTFSSTENEGVKKEENFEMQKRRFIKVIQKKKKGCKGIEDMIFSLKSVYQQGVVVDIGANVGQVAAIFLSVMNEIELRSFPHNTVCYREHRKKLVKIFSIEPSPVIFEILKERSIQRNWEENGFSAFHLAMSHEDKEGMIYYSDKDIEQASLSKEGSHYARSEIKNYTVTIRRLDTFFLEQNIKEPIFLLKIDAEGYDPLVIKGANGLIKNDQVRFISFEFGNKWAKSHKHTLSEVIDWMTLYGYACFFITSRLVPIYGKWWDGSYNSVKWKNIFCAKFNDPDILRIVYFYNGEDLMPDDLYSHEEKEQKTDTINEEEEE